MNDWADLEAAELWTEAQLIHGNTVADGCNAIAAALRNAHAKGHAKGYADGYAETRREASHFHGVTLADMAKWREVMEEAGSPFEIIDWKTVAKDISRLLKDAEKSKE